jgi:hypothetical protein
MIVAPPIKKPCLERWNDMRGDNRARLCEQCQLHVQNLSAMSRREIARVLSPGRGEHVCITYVRRADGNLATRATLLRERCLAPFWRGFSHALRALTSVALALCRTPQEKLFLGTWKVIAPRRPAAKAGRITFHEDHSFFSSASPGGEGKVEVRGSWYADNKNIHLWCQGKRSVWSIVALRRDELRLQSNAQVAVYKRAGRSPY